MKNIEMASTFGNKGGNPPSHVSLDQTRCLHHTGTPSDMVNSEPDDMLRLGDFHNGSTIHLYRKQNVISGKVTTTGARANIRENARISTEEQENGLED